MNSFIQKASRAVSSAVITLVGTGIFATTGFAQTVTGSMSVSPVGPSASSTLTLNYSGFTSNSTGMNLRVYYDSSAVTPGTVTYATPPGSSQPFNPATAGTLAACAGANSYIRLNWVDFGGTWPTPTSGSLGTVAFTTAPTFAANTLICFVEDLSQGAPQRNITGNTVLAAIVAPTPVAPTISSLANATLTAGSGSVVVNVATAGTATASVALGCTIPAGSAAFAITGGASRTISAPAALGANAPAIGLRCTPQATVQTATLNCTQTATPGPNPPSLTSTVTCPAAAVAVITPGNSPGTLTLPGYVVGSPPASSSAILSFNTTVAPGAISCVPTGAGYSASPNPLNIAVGTSGVLTVTYNGTVAGTFTGSLTCTPVAPATGGPFVYALSTTVTAAPDIVPTAPVPAVGGLGLFLLCLMILGFTCLRINRKPLKQAKPSR